jgi:hypothetical protein
MAAHQPPRDETRKRYARDGPLQYLCTVATLAAMMAEHVALGLCVDASARTASAAAPASELGTSPE